MANDFDEEAAYQQYIQFHKPWCEDSGLPVPFERQYGFVEGARYQHSLMQERLAAANAEIKRLEGGTNAAMDLMIKAERERDEFEKMLKTEAFEHDQLESKLKNHLDSVRQANAQLSATCERMRLALEFASKTICDENCIPPKQHTDTCEMLTKALESGERSGD